jgi:hypothetical protein
MINDFLHWFGGTPCFLIHGKGRREMAWRVISVYASARRTMDSRWPLLRGASTAWGSDVIAVGWDFAEWVLLEQLREPASRQRPVTVAGGRLGDARRRAAAGESRGPSVSEVLAHECGHTWQALRMGPAYLPLVGSVTLFREGPRPRNRFENEASEEGMFGGIVNRSVCPRLQQLLTAEVSRGSER